MGNGLKLNPWLTPRRENLDYKCMFSVKLCGVSVTIQLLEYLLPHIWSDPTKNPIKFAHNVEYKRFKFKSCTGVSGCIGIKIEHSKLCSPEQFWFSDWCWLKILFNCSALYNFLRLVVSCNASSQYNRLLMPDFLCFLHPCIQPVQWVLLLLSYISSSSLLLHIWDIELYRWRFSCISCFV